MKRKFLMTLWGMAACTLCVPTGGPLWLLEQVFNAGLFCARKYDDLQGGRASE